MTSTPSALAHRTPHRINADASRVVLRLFVPGQEGFDEQESRSSAVLRRVLALDDTQVRRALDDVVQRFAGRHHRMEETFYRHSGELSERLDPESELSDVRRLLIGATFTSEYAIEGAALCNPSMVAHPDQRGLSNGAARFIMSVRGIGEGHKSSIGFRTGVLDQSGGVTFDDAPSFTEVGDQEQATLSAAAFRGELGRLRGGGDDADFVLKSLGHRFTVQQLEIRLQLLERQAATRKQAKRIIAMFRKIAERTYSIQFKPDSPLNERVLLPSMAAESMGLEDARFVRFTEDDGSVVYYATYTAYNGTDIGQQLLETTDFSEFNSSPLSGASAANKGLALFPRRINGRFVALSRSDRESNSVTYSDDLRHWQESYACQVPVQSWEVLQLGNCGSPMETEVGWVVLTHGVGPMRTYNIGAILLDLEDPTRILGSLSQPLLSPQPDEQDGYVPNVVYSCGALLHERTIVIPYGIGDSSIGVATVNLDPLLESLMSSASDPPHAQREGAAHAR
jgi:predicted GH43/DUF377 family glycosyl hydrolase